MSRPPVPGREGASPAGEVPPTVALPVTSGGDVGEPGVTSAPATPPRWRRRIPAHLGRARTSTVVLCGLFVAVFALYLAVRPLPEGSTGGTVPVPAGVVTTTDAPAAPTTEAPPSEATPTTTEAPATTSLSTAPTTTDSSPATTGDEPTTTAPDTGDPDTTDPDTTDPDTTDSSVPADPTGSADTTG